jgi:predicted esterase
MRFFTAFPSLLLAAGLAPISPPEIYRDKDGKEIITYVASLPARRLPGATAGLWLGFHGRGGDANQLIGAMTSGLQKAGLRDEFAVIGLKSKADGWDAADDEPVRKFITFALKNWNLDPRRIYGLGYSSGAFYLNRFAPNNSDLFAGAVTYVGGQGGIAKTDQPENRAELYWVVGLKDTTVRADSVRPSAQAFVKAGFRAVYREMADMGHEVAKEPTFEESIQWMKALRNKQAPVRPEDGTFLEKLGDPARAASLLTESGTWQKLTLIGGHAAAPAVLEALKSDRESARTYAAQACQKMMFDAAVVGGLVGLLEDKESKVRQHALAALAFQGRFGYLQAQEALSACAMDPKRPLADRKEAIQGLSQIVKLDLLGGFQEKKVIWTLVLLLDDPEGSLRALAFAVLKGVDPAGFEYAPGASKEKRAASLEKWTAWAKKVCGEKPAP